MQSRSFQIDLRPCSPLPKITPSFAGCKSWKAPPELGTRSKGSGGARVLRCHLTRCTELSWEETVPKPPMQNLHPLPSTSRLHLSPNSPRSIIYWTKQHPPVSPVSLPFLLMKFAFQDKNIQQKQLLTRLGNVELLESDVQVTDDYAQHPLPGRVMFLEG